MPSVLIRRGFGPRRNYRSPTQRAIESAEYRARNRTHPKMTLQAGALRMTVPYAPRTSNHTGFAFQHTEVLRPGRKPLVVRTGLPLWKQSFDLFLGVNDPALTIGTDFLLLRSIAESPDPITIVNGPGINRTWRITSMSLSALERARLNQIHHGIVTIEMTEVSDLTPTPGPVAKAETPKAPPAPPPPPAPSKPAPAPRIHTVSKGESLSLISKRYYGTISRWPELAKVNNIRNANLIYPGQKLRIP